MTTSRYFDKKKAGFVHADPILYPLLKENAKRLRNNPTLAEEYLWERLRQNQLGLPFRRQHIIKEYIADFACLPAMLVIEVDGEYHETVRQQCHDEFRTEEIEALGFQVIRFKNEEILNSLDSVIEQIKQIINEKN